MLEGVFGDGAFNGVGHDVAGGVLAGGSEVDEARADGGDALHEGMRGDVLVGDGERSDAGAGHAETLEGAVVGGAFDEDVVAALDEQGADEGDGLLAAGGDEDLVGDGGGFELGVVAGDGLAEEREAEGEVLACGEHGVDVAEAGGECGSDDGREWDGGGGGGGEVDGAGLGGLEGVEQRAAGDEGGAGDGADGAGVFGADPGAGAGAAFDPAGAAEVVVGGDDGGAADGEGLGEEPLGGEAHAGKEVALADGVLDSGGEALVERAGEGGPGVEDLGDAIDLHGYHFYWKPSDQGNASFLTVRVG